MAGSTNFPSSLDDNTSLYDVSDGVSSVQAAHHNNLKEAIKAIEAVIGISGTSVATTIEYRLGHPTFGHDHSGATGMGKLISQPNPTPYLKPHPTYNDAAQLATFIKSIRGISDPTYVDSYLYFDHEQALLHGGRYIDYAVNDYNPGGDRISKHWFYGGWGIVPPFISTSGIIPTYSTQGQIYWDDVAKKMRIYTGSTWRAMAFE